MRPLLAVALDTTCLLLFAATGRQTHTGVFDPVETSIIAAPFVLAWFSASEVFHLRHDPLNLKRATCTWALGIPLAMVLRNLVFARGTAISFVFVASAVTAATLLGWRLFASWRQHNQQTSQNTEKSMAS